MKWKSAALYLGIAIIVMTLFGMRVDAETITWSNPSIYTDNSAIPPAKVAQLSTEIQYRIGAGPFTAFGTATGGASIFSAPYVTVGGGTSYWRARSISVADNNSTSVWSPEFPFVRAYQTPAPGAIQSIQ